MGCFTMLLSISTICYSLGAAAADSQPDYRLLVESCTGEGSDELVVEEDAAGEALLSSAADGRRSSRGVVN